MLRLEGSTGGMLVPGLVKRILSRHLCPALAVTQQPRTVTNMYWLRRSGFARGTGPSQSPETCGVDVVDAASSAASFGFVAERRLCKDLDKSKVEVHRHSGIPLSVSGM